MDKPRKRRRMSPKLVKKAAMVEMALDYRTAGMKYQTIADAMGLGKTQAFRLVAAGLEELEGVIKEKAGAVREIELRRLDAIIVAHWNRRQNPECAKVIMKAMERRAKYLGLDAAEKQAITFPQLPVKEDVDYGAFDQTELDMLEALAEKAEALTVKAEAPAMKTLPAPKEVNDDYIDE